MVVSPLFDDPPLVENVDTVRFANRTETVGDDDAGHPSAVQAFIDDLLRPVVESTGRLIEEENFGSANQCPGDEQSLPLTAGEIGAAFTDHSVQLHRHLMDVIGDPRFLDRLPGFFHGVHRADGDVFKDGSGTDMARLQYDS